MFRFLSAILIIALTVIHVGAANTMPMDGSASIRAVSNTDNGRLPNLSAVNSTNYAVDCCEQDTIDKQQYNSHCQIAHCQTDCGLIGQQSAIRTLLQLRNIDFALGSFTIANEPEIPLRPPIA